MTIWKEALRFSNLARSSILAAWKSSRSLQILEMQYQKDKEYKQKVQYLERELKAELSTLKIQLTESKQESMNLNQLLHQERLTTQKLTTYSAGLEQEQRKNQLLFQEQEQQIFRLKNDIKNCVIVIICLSLVIIISVLLLILFLKLKK